MAVMGRSYAPLLVSIWDDPDFRAMSTNAQRAYFLIMSQPEVNYCGVTSYMERRWARSAADWSVAGLVEAIEELENARFIEVDRDTDEVWIRSFIKHNKVLEQPKLAKAMRREYREIHSERLKRLIWEALPLEERDELQKPRSLPLATPTAYPKPGVPDTPSKGEAGPKGIFIPIPIHEPSSSPPPEAEEEEDEIRQAAMVVAERRLARRNDVQNPKAWKARVAADVADEMRAAGNWDPDAYEPPRKLDPVEATQAAARKIMQRSECSACDSTGFVFDEHDDAMPCPKCNASAVAS